MVAACVPTRSGRTRGYVFRSAIKQEACIAARPAIQRPRRSVAQPGSASGLGPEGREFESLHSDQSRLL